jgi:hypothetical protein
MLLEHVKASTKIQDPINRPDGKESTDPVMTALRSIVEASKQEVPTAKKFKNLIPEATFLRIDRPDQKPLVYTMTLDRDLRTKAFAVSMLQNEDPAKARVTIYPGVLTAYPNFIFRIKENEIGDFANQLIAAETPEQFTGLVEKWGVRRSNPDFWNVLHSITGYVQNQTPERAAIFDINRYQNL